MSDQPTTTQQIADIARKLDDWQLLEVQPDGCVSVRRSWQADTEAELVRCLAYWQPGETLTIQRRRSHWRVEMRQTVQDGATGG